MPDSRKAIANLNEDLVNVLGKQDSWGAGAVRKAESGKASAIERFYAWEMTGNKDYLAELYGEEMRKQAETMYSRTEGHWWTDRVELDNSYLQRARLGGIALVRGNIYPGATVSWSFADPNGAESVALLLPNPSRSHFKVVAYNITGKPVTAKMTGWNVDAGEWEVKSGRGDAHDALAAPVKAKTVAFEKTASIDVAFAPHTTTVYEFTLKKPSGDAPESRADLGIGADDVKRDGSAVTVTVHSLGAKDAAPAKVRIVDAKGKVVAETTTPALTAPRDLKPHTVTVKLILPANFDAAGSVVRVVSPEPEITQMNNMVRIPAN